MKSSKRVGEQKTQCTDKTIMMEPKKSGDISVEATQSAFKPLSKTQSLPTMRRVVLLVQHSFSRSVVPITLMYARIPIQMMDVCNFTLFAVRDVSGRNVFDKLVKLETRKSFDICRVHLLIVQHLKNWRSISEVLMLTVTVRLPMKNWLELFVKQHLNDANVIHEMFVATDTDCDGRITFVEFLKMMQEYDLTKTMLRLYDDIDNGVFTVFRS
ncbi:hypothetical protein KIN20_008631 [Parelaphostrongylus tenuis]|uniref:EF-hand domain-containing protein n=1 Tax=Parelaphostrongylus tenuis TaxID=148309 RepID=A0AAD5QJ14_PARTN|nr:hypothetical protein KIN20_008631 [Parelaphostrongylus tenuis]